MKLSKRLEMVVSFAGREQKKAGAEEMRSRGEPGTAPRRVADVGTDHGYVPIALVLRDPEVRVVAMDVRPGPLERARAHIREQGLEERIETRLGDGVEKLKEGEADTVIIAGMGGELVIHILEGGRRLWDAVGRWILSPQSELDKVRRYLDSHGFIITDEAMVEEDGKYYTVMEAARRRRAAEPEKARPEGFAGAGGAEKPEDVGQGGLARPDGAPGPEEMLRQAGYLYGPRLIEKKDPVLARFLEREDGQLTEIIERLGSRENPHTAARREELRRRRSLVRRALDEVTRPGGGGEGGKRGEGDI